jgi:nucleoside-diphosphate-sugar epimerase
MPDRAEQEQCILVVGASGATGRLLVEQLLGRGKKVKAVVRSVNSLPEAIRIHPLVDVVHANLLDLDAVQMHRVTEDCDAVASCLGHNLSLKGLFGPPYRLVTDATQRLSDALRSHPRETPARFVLMNTAGNRNQDLRENVSLGQRLVIGLLRLLVPPHVDNERAADFLRLNVGRGSEDLEWCVVRPDTLTDASELRGYDVFESPIRSALFDPGTTSRLNVARFMADLITDQKTWSRWHGQMPVIYDHQPFG